MSTETIETAPKRGKGKIGKTVKEDFLAVFIRLGSTAAMAKWAERHQTEFYRLYARLIPTEQHISGVDGDEPIRVIVEGVRGSPGAVS